MHGQIPLSLGLTTIHGASCGQINLAITLLHLPSACTARYESLKFDWQRQHTQLRKPPYRIFSHAGILLTLCWKPQMYVLGYWCICMSVWEFSKHSLITPSSFPFFLASLWVPETNELHIPSRTACLYWPNMNTCHRVSLTSDQTIGKFWHIFSTAQNSTFI